MKSKLIDYLKLISGKVCITFTCAIGFLMIIHTLCEILILKCNDMSFDNIYNIFNVVILIISNVITFYFTRNKK
jgi:hypothetical protein